MIDLKKYQKLLSRFDETSSILSLKKSEAKKIKNKSNNQKDLILKKIIPSFFLLAFYLWGILFNGYGVIENFTTYFSFIPFFVINISLFPFYFKKIGDELFFLIAIVILNILVFFTGVLLLVDQKKQFTDLELFNIALNGYNELMPLIVCIALSIFFWKLHKTKFETEDEINKEFNDINKEILMYEEVEESLHIKVIEMNKELSSIDELDDIEYLESYSEIEGLVLVENIIKNLKDEIIKEKGYKSRAEYILKEREFQKLSIHNT